MFSIFKQKRNYKFKPDYIPIHTQNNTYSANWKTVPSKLIVGLIIPWMMGL